MHKTAEHVQERRKMPLVKFRCRGWGNGIGFCRFLRLADGRRRTAVQPRALRQRRRAAAGGKSQRHGQYGGTYSFPFHRRSLLSYKNSPYRSGSFTLRFDAEGRIVEMVQTITQDIAQTAYVGEEEVDTGTQALTTQIVIRYKTPALSEAEAVIDPLWQEASSG